MEECYQIKNRVYDKEEYGGGYHKRYENREFEKNTIFDLSGVFGPGIDSMFSDIMLLKKSKYYSDMIVYQSSEVFEVYQRTFKRVRYQFSDDFHFRNMGFGFLLMREIAV